MFNDFLVTKIVQESSTVRSFYLVRKDGQIPETFLPGQFVTVAVTPDGAKTFTRNYTLSDRPGLAYYRITVKKETEGKVSSFLHKKIAIGDTIKVSLPAGAFYLNEGDRSPVALISGGVGITPMISMLEHMAEHQNNRNVYFLHSSTNKEVQPMQARLANLRALYPQFLIQLYHSNPIISEREGVDYDFSGRINAHYLKNNLPITEDCTFYLCGPLAFMRDMYAHLIGLGVAESKIKFEFFGNGATLGLSNDKTSGNEEKYKVTFVKSKVTAAWTGKHQSLLELAESSGVAAANSCRMGTCATCETGIIVGEVTYDPEPFLEVRKNRVLICCSQPISDIKLDL